MKDREECFLLKICDSVNRAHINGIQRKRINMLFNWMQEHKRYKKLLNQHYEISSEIIEGVNKQPNYLEIYDYLYVNLIKVLDCFIYVGNYKAAIRFYKRFIGELKRKFCSEKETYETIS